MTSTSNILIEPLNQNDRAAWSELFAQYAEFYGFGMPHDVSSEVWHWLHEPAHPVVGLAARLGRHMVGFAHYRRYPMPIFGQYGTYLDDLFVAGGARGRGVATELIRAVQIEAYKDGSRVVRWKTAPTNEPARRCYEQVAELTPWMTFEATPRGVADG